MQAPLVGILVGMPWPGPQDREIAQHTHHLLRGEALLSWGMIYSGLLNGGALCPPPCPHRRVPREEEAY